LGFGGSGGLNYNNGFFRKMNGVGSSWKNPYCKIGKKWEEKSCSNQLNIGSSREKAHDHYQTYDYEIVINE
jgi:hypothetical protein